MYGAIAFVGREAELDRLHDLLQQETPVAICAVSGMGGIGKTELALQYALKHRDLGTYPGGICWLRARQEVKTQLVEFARSHLGLDLPLDLELEAKVQQCWQHWRDGETLIIFDDVQQYEEIRDSLPPGRSRFKVMLTTRLRLGRSFRELNLEVLSEGAALDLLRSIVQDERVDQEIALAKQLCEWLGYLPLGLELVARYLVEDEDLSLQDLWAELQDQRIDAEALKQIEPGMTATVGVFKAFELSWNKLIPEAQQLAGVLSLFATAPIEWHLVQACLPAVNEQTLKTLRNKRLLGLHLLQRVGQEMYQLHPLLREFFAAKREQRADVDAMKQAFCQAMVAVAQQIPYTPTLSLIEQITPALPHLKEAATTFAPWLTDADLIMPSVGISRFYEGQAAYAEAEEWYKQCRAIATQHLGADHPDVATMLNNLATLYYAQGRYAEAEPLYHRALAIGEQQLGADHPLVATYLNNLALLYSDQGRYGQAEPLFLRALAIGEQQLGADHPLVATYLNNLANLYRAQGRYAEAEPVYLRALAIGEQQLGADHLLVATYLNNLAELYRAQGRYGEVEPLYRKAVAIGEQQLGADHPDVATTLNNLAGLYRKQGRYAEAEPLFLRALAIGEQQLGADHPAVATRLNNLANLYRDQGRDTEAEPLYSRALAISEQQLGADHPAVATRLNNLAGLYRAQGRYAEAEPLFLRALAIGEQQLGVDHLLVATYLNNLAGLYRAQGRDAEAEPLYLRTIDIDERCYGFDHPEVATDLNNLAGLYESQRRYAEAEPLYLRALTIQTEKLGDDHPKTQTVRQNFRGFLQAVMAAGETGQLSDHPVTQELLRQIREGSGE